MYCYKCSEYFKVDNKKNTSLRCPYCCKDQGLTAYVSPKKRHDVIIAEPKSLVDRFPTAEIDVLRNIDPQISSMDNDLFEYKIIETFAGVFRPKESRLVNIVDNSNTRREILNYRSFGYEAVWISQTQNVSYLRYKAPGNGGLVTWEKYAYLVDKIVLSRPKNLKNIDGIKTIEKEYEIAQKRHKTFGLLPTAWGLMFVIFLIPYLPLTIAFSIANSVNKKKNLKNLRRQNQLIIEAKELLEK